MKEDKERPKWPLKRLKGMYFGLHCWKCKKFERGIEGYSQCEGNIQKIIDNLEVKEMKFKEFNNIIKNSNFCKFEKRDFHPCPICERMGIPQKRFW